MESRQPTRTIGDELKAVAYVLECTPAEVGGYLVISVNEEYAYNLKSNIKVPMVLVHVLASLVCDITRDIAGLEQDADPT
jgi:LytS/YehU family sensor histidine kinase